MNCSAEALVLREDSLSTGHPLRDLGERTAQFGEAIIRFAKKIPQNPVNNRLIDQLVGAGTSVGANFCEADNSVSGKDFKQRIGTCRKESKETMFFLRMVATAEEESGFRSASALAGSKGIKPHLRRNLEEVIDDAPTHQPFRPSDFGLRIFLRISDLRSSDFAPL